MKGYMQEWYTYSEGNLNEAVKDAMEFLNKERREYIDIIPFEVDNKILLIYKDSGSDKTNAPIEDIHKFSQSPSTNQAPSEEHFHQPHYAPEEDNSLSGLAKRYWFIVAIFIAFAAWYFLGG